MQDKTIRDHYRRAKEKAKRCYYKLHVVPCPKLGESVIFDETGFRHLLQKGRRFRPKSEQIRRFSLLKYARMMLEDPNTKISHHSHSQNPNTNYWVFEYKDNTRNIKLIVRQIGSGKKHFLSIYGKIQKSTH